MILVDQRLGPFVLLYEDLDRMIFHTAEELWLEIGLRKGSDYKLIPANMLADGVIFLKVNQAFVAEKYKLFKQMKESETVSFKVERSFEPCSYLQESQTLKNFEINTKYNKAFSSDFMNFQFGEPQFRELLEYHTIAEFNKVRGKDFISFASFHGVYTEAYKKHPFIPNYTKLLVEKLKTGNPTKANVIIVSGIPGSGKSKLTESLAKLLSAEGLPAVAFKPSGPIADQVKFSTGKFIQQILEFKEIA